MAENVVIDSESFTDLEPQLAPEWSAVVKMVPSPACLLGEYLSDFLALCNNQRSLVDMLGDAAAYMDNSDQVLSSAFNRLTESSIPTISKVVNRGPARKNSKNVDGPIAEEVMISILYFLFPDAEESPVSIDSELFPVDINKKTLNALWFQKSSYGDMNSYSVDDDLWRGVKTCALEGLVWRLAIVAAHCAHNLGGAVALAQLWHEFVQEIRFRWERSILIPG